jgi:hypothetical protein
VPSSSGFPALAVCKDLSRAELYPSSNANCLQGLLAARFECALPFERSQKEGLTSRYFGAHGERLGQPKAASRTLK